VTYAGSGGMNETKLSCFYARNRLHESTRVYYFTRLWKHYIIGRKDK